MTELERAILNYLLQHDKACDTLYGIAEHWVLQQQFEQLVKQVDEALQVLVDRGFVSVDQSPATGPLYRLNGRRTEEIRHRLDQNSSCPETPNPRGD